MKKQSLKSEYLVLNMGPSHPATHGTVKFLMTLDGERIIDCDVEIGYLHRGFEKECEHRNWQQVFPYTDRLNYNSAVMNNVAYALAVEKLLEIEVTDRCKYIRVITSELARIADHITNIGAGALELGAFSAFLYFIEAREMIWGLLESVCGARLTSNYIRIGGVSSDLPDDFKYQVKNVFEKIRPLYTDVDSLLTKNRIFLDRMRGIGIISMANAVEYGFTGPCLRACGIEYDVRKSEPYLVYDEIDFDIPIGDVGDNFDRYLVRMEEINQSIRIVEQALLKLPQGPINLNNPRIRLSSKEDVYNKMEELIFHFKLVTEGIKPPIGEVYFPTEGANGELGFYLVSNGSGKPVKCRVRPPCFAITQALPIMVKGHLLADLIPTFDMINLIGGECDR